LTNGTAAGDADYTTTNVTVTVPAGATTGISVPTTADTIDGKMKLYHCFWNGWLLVPLSIMMLPYCGIDHCCNSTKEADVCSTLH
jgi:hypothetical protein